MARMTRAEERAAELRAQRDGRKPLGGFQAKLGAKHIPEGYTARWFNGREDRIEAAKAAGWEHAPTGSAEKPTDLGTAQSVIAGTHEGGAVRRDYLMMIPTDIYREDQLRKQSGVNEAEAAIRQSGIPDASKAGGLAGHTYLPNGATSAVTVRHGAASDA